MTHIGLMGTHGTGKSTYARKLFNDLKREHPGENIALVKEVARKCQLPLNRDTSEDAQLWIFNSQMVAELEAIQTSEIVICDRTIIDSLAYAEAAGFMDLVDACMPQALYWLETYSEIYWFRPVEGRLVEDGFRSIDPVFQNEIDGILTAWIHLYGIFVREIRG